MPRIMAPPPSGEFNIKLQKPFSGPPSHTVEITGEPNRSANIKVTKHHKEGTIEEKEGTMSQDDVKELMSLVSQLRGLPTHADKDIYGLDLSLELQTMEIQWANYEEMQAPANEVPAETKQQFKDVADSIDAAGRQFAKRDARV
ncbi:hypothetical protein H2203_001809 [Taxawa tesnikishii (nom. ined.)]|nr:hypothetical protein H2203_001809 [Dothideales sp. JES 119]